MITAPTTIILDYPPVGYNEDAVVFQNEDREEDETNSSTDCCSHCKVVIDFTKEYHYCIDYSEVDLFRLCQECYDSGFRLCFMTGVFYPEEELIALVGDITINKNLHYDIYETYMIYPNKREYLNMVGIHYADKVYHFYGINCNSEAGIDPSLLDVSDDEGLRPPLGCDDDEENDGTVGKKADSDKEECESSGSDKDSDGDEEDCESSTDTDSSSAEKDDEECESTVADEESEDGHN